MQACTRRFIWPALALWIALAFPGVQAAPELPPLFEAHDENSSARVDHRVWNEFLSRFLRSSPDGVTRVAYGAADYEVRSWLALYLSDLQRVPVLRLRRSEQRAFWINFYNAATIKLVLDRYPVQSIRDINISPGFFVKGPWGAQRYKVEGQNLSLDDVDQRILRPVWNDPRIHYALNRAALGGPDLAPRAYTAENTESLLDETVRAFVNHPRGARIEDGRLHVSGFYAWFRKDFGNSDAGIIAHLRQYATPEFANALSEMRKFSSDDFDWSLNDAR
jgi:hypothetical protein